MASASVFQVLQQTTKASCARQHSLCLSRSLSLSLSFGRVRGREVSPSARAPAPLTVAEGLDCKNLQHQGKFCLSLSLSLCSWGKEVGASRCAKLSTLALVVGVYVVLGCGASVSLTLSPPPQAYRQVCCSYIQEARLFREPTLCSLHCELRHREETATQRTTTRDSVTQLTIWQRGSPSVEQMFDHKVCMQGSLPGWPPLLLFLASLLQIVSPCFFRRAGRLSLSVSFFRKGYEQGSCLPCPRAVRRPRHVRWAISERKALSKRQRLPV